MEQGLGNLIRKKKTRRQQRKNAEKSKESERFDKQARVAAKEETSTNGGFL